MVDAASDVFNGSVAVAVKRVEEGKNAGMIQGRVIARQSKF